MWSKGSLIVLALSLMTATAGEAAQPPRRDRNSETIAQLEREVAQMKRELQQLRSRGPRTAPPGQQGQRFEFRVNPPGEHDRLAMGGDHHASQGAKSAGAGATGATKPAVGRDPRRSRSASLRFAIVRAYLRPPVVRTLPELPMLCGVPPVLPAL